MSERSPYDVVIVGAGPAGIFAALELVKQDNLKVLLLEKGQDIEKRTRLIQKKNPSSSPCPPLTCGWGGAGAFSDGKLNLSTEIGGWLSEYLPDQKLLGLITYVDQIYQNLGGPEETYGENQEEIKELQKRAKEAGLTLIPGRIKHLGTERCRDILKELRQFLDKKVEIRTGTPVKKILVNQNGEAKGVLTGGGEEILSSKVVVAPGREGSEWLKTEAQRLGLKLTINAVDIGLRMEVPAEVLAPLTNLLYETKLIYHSKSFQDKVRTFCMNPYGEVTTEVYGDLITVNGHSYANRKTANTNFALLVSTTFTEPFKEPIAYGKYIARLANLLGGGIIVQRLGDLKQGRRSTVARMTQGKVRPTLKEAAPGDLSFALPYRYLTNILEMVEALDKLAPGLDSSHNLLYGVEVKFYSSRLKLSKNLETEIKNLYAVGDGAGITRGLVQASCAGVIAARSILNSVESGK